MILFSEELLITLRFTSGWMKISQRIQRNLTDVLPFNPFNPLRLFSKELLITLRFTNGWMKISTQRRRDAETQRFCYSLFAIFKGIPH